MNIVYQVYNDKTDTVIMETEDKLKALLFMSNIDENNPLFKDTWIREKE